ncbi:twin-arginine translocase subunit TatA [Lamprobacter modestohalophilus]|uniref:Sec-independent protein translocase protein TatA n=1 Tax=Lamprobacter modestohalophilus TaxID=1064514 RepID=A0A9X0W781_9GAMM|nr:twin-arginine translocase TatA/TatE family subunit [Lamprobacter modestohalophilus]MBK1618126.1 twin-arginine translocase subunit TatA [Lamprobacter modestohalophilus]MCF7976572.1 twin-arginine translocase TatA/TatE family subunit [Chromatiaceae bacterium]MCF7993920.1 twin-arginine translocase TatA/TatE family subunit [Chromatiaceae bacterium]MCF8015186.1 twin-arginine translocase TatA/TatE family subunit [Chromatiaceae bacterium]
MGVGGIGIWQLLIILLIVVLLFGTKRLKGIGSDLGNAVKGFRSAMSDADKADEEDKDPKRLDAAKSEQAADDATGSTSDSVSDKPAEKTKV